MSSRIVFMRAAAIVAALALPFHAQSAHGQLRGNYPPGFAGMLAGTQPPPGVVVELPVMGYTTNTLKDDDGHTVGPRPQVTSLLIAPGISWVLPVKWYGAHVGGSALLLPFLQTGIEGARLNGTGSLKFSDLYIEPLELGWHLDQADFLAGYEAVIPTGKYRFADPANGGMGMFGNLIHGGATLWDDSGEWSTSLLGTFEFHGDKKGTEVHTGDILTFEGGTGRTFTRRVNSPPLIATVGLAYYAQFKTSRDHAPSADPLFAGRQDQVYGIGGEFDMYVPWAKLQTSIRLLGELGAHNRTQGLTMAVQLGHRLHRFGPQQL